jgi:hypothetical protein
MLCRGSHDVNFAPDIFKGAPMRGSLSCLVETFGKRRKLLSAQVQFEVLLDGRVAIARNPGAACTW